MAKSKKLSAVEQLEMEIKVKEGECAKAAEELKISEETMSLIVADIEKLSEDTDKEEIDVLSKKLEEVTSLHATQKEYNDILVSELEALNSDLKQAKEEDKDQKPKTKAVKRLRNAEMIEKLKALKAEFEYERNLRTNKENVLDRENAFQLDGLIRNLSNLTFSFEMFTRPPKAQ